MMPKQHQTPPLPDGQTKFAHNTHCPKCGAGSVVRVGRRHLCTQADCGNRWYPTRPQGAIFQERRG